MKKELDCLICGGSGYVLLEDGSAGACEYYKERSLLPANNDLRLQRSE